MKTSEEVTFGMVVEMWREYLFEAFGRFVEKHLVLRAIRVRTACTSPVHRHRRARQRRKIEAKLRRIERQLEQIAEQRANDFKAEFALQKDQALLQSDLLNL